MNNPRRKKLEAIVEQLAEVYAQEVDALDNMPESIQLSAQGERSQEALDVMDDALEGLRNLANNVT